jgi:hypothetical protein
MLIIVSENKHQDLLGFEFMVSSCYHARGKNVMHRKSSTKVLLYFGITVVYVEPRKTLLSGDVHKNHLIVIRKIITTKATQESCSRTKSFTESMLRLISQIDTYVEYARTSNLVQTGVSHI